MNLKPRPFYLEKLLAFKDSEFIKVLVGMRRCGKSSLLHLFADHLKTSGVAEDHIVMMNFEAADFLEIDDHKKLLDHLHSLLDQKPSPEKHYLLLDEIQLVDQWEKAVNALRLRDDVDIYLTGSNAYLLSSQLATLLSGRYVEIEIYPLSFKEFVSFIGEAVPTSKTLDRFTTYGGLPPVVEQNDDVSLAQTVLSGIYNTVLVKDIAQYTQIRNQAIFADIASFIADTTGSSVSITNIEKKLASANRKTANETIERYIQSLVDAFLLYRARRYNLRGKALLQGLEKYYYADLGIRNMLLGFPAGNYGYVLENLVHNELLVRGYSVQVGKLDALEIDFVAQRNDEVLYVQACASLLEETTRKREIAPLQKIDDLRGKKIIITYDTVGTGMTGNIEIVSVLDWLMR